MNIKKTYIPKTLHRYEPVVILGTGSFAQDLEVILLNHGFFVERKITTDDLPTLTNKNIQLVVGIFNRITPYSMLIDKAKLNGFQNIFLPWEYYSRFITDLGWRYWLSDPELIFNNINNINKVYNMLSDDHSKNLLQSICEFRTGNDNNYSHFIDQEPQYFNSITLQDDIKYYIDGGAYNGDTFQQLQNSTAIDKAMLFEPDTDNFKKLTKNVVSAVCLPLAISDKTELLTFNMGHGESSNLNTNGGNKVMAISLDDMFAKVNVDFIKLDLEGGEIPALLGAKNLIKFARPKLAISLYHRPEDLWEIPLLLYSICNNYNFYIRQHFYNSFDSVLYGIPK
jgi:FkbM family methyltransferase